MDVFKNRAQALGYLKAQGYKIEKTRFYDDCRTGKVALEPSGAVTHASLQLYISTNQLEKPAESSLAAMRIHEKKTAAASRYLQLKSEKLQLDLDVARAKLIPKEEADMYASDLSAALDAVPRHIMLRNVVTYITLVSGDPGRARQLLNKFNTDLDDEIDLLFAKVGHVTIDVKPEKDIQNENES